MKFVHQFHRTALHIAVEKENIEIVKSLLSNNTIDVNIKSISICYLLITFQLKSI